MGPWWMRSKLFLETDSPLKSQFNEVIRIPLPGKNTRHVLLTAEPAHTESDRLRSFWMGLNIVCIWWVGFKGNSPGATFTPSSAGSSILGLPSIFSEKKEKQPAKDVLLYKNSQCNGWCSAAWCCATCRLCTGTEPKYPTVLWYKVPLLIILFNVYNNKKIK